MIHLFLMKIIFFARTLGSTRLCKISQECGLLSDFANLSKIRNSHFGRCGPLEVKGDAHVYTSHTYIAC